MSSGLQITGYFAGALFSAQDIYGNRALAQEIERQSQGIVRLQLPQDMSAQETGDAAGTRAADYLGMIRCDFVFANMNGGELDSGTVAEYVVASMLGMPRVQFRSDFRNVGDVRSEFPSPVMVRKTAEVPYNLMLGHDESATVFADSMKLYKSCGSLQEFLTNIAEAAIAGIKLAFLQTEIARPGEYASSQRGLAGFLGLDASTVAKILEEKKQRHLSGTYRQAIEKLSALNLSGY